MFGVPYPGHQARLNRISASLDFVDVSPAPPKDDVLDGSRAAISASERHPLEAEADGDRQRAQRRGHGPCRCSLPLSILVWPALPLAVIVSPIVLVAGLFWRLNHFTAVAVLFGLVIALGGVLIDVESPGVRVKLFLG